MRREKEIKNEFFHEGSRFTQVKCEITDFLLILSISQAIFGMYLILKHPSLCVQNSHVTRCPVIYLATHSSAPGFSCLVKIQAGGSKRRGWSLMPSSQLGCLIIISLISLILKIAGCAHSLAWESN